MGNCHAVDPVSATVEHPSGQVEKLYFASSARQLMLQHPGHYVALLPPPPPPPTAGGDDGGMGNVKRKLKLLRPDAMLNIGSCYKLVSFEDVLSELSDTGSMAHQTSSRRRAQSVTAPTAKHHQRSPTQGGSKGQTGDGSSKTAAAAAAAGKHVQHLRAMLAKSFGPHKEPVSPPLPADLGSFSSIQSPLESLRPIPRGGAWRPNLQSIAERGR